MLIKKSFSALMASAMALVLLLSACDMTMVHVTDPSEPSEPEQTGRIVEPHTEASTSSAGTAPLTTSDTEETPNTSTEQTTEAPERSEPTGPQYAARPEASAAKDPTYFADALFIGDSRTQGLMLYGTLYDANFVYNKGYNVGVFFKDVIKIGSAQQTGAAYVQSNAGNFKDVYIGFGINETGWPLTGFINTYREIVRFVKQHQAQANIYIMAILPVANSLDDHAYSNNKTIREFNLAMDQMADEENVYFLDASSVVAGNDGALPADASPDGIHFDRTYTMLWQEYIQTHVAPPKN